MCDRSVLAFNCRCHLLVGSVKAAQSARAVGEVGHSLASRGQRCRRISCPLFLSSIRSLEPFQRQLYVKKNGRYYPLGICPWISDSTQPETSLTQHGRIQIQHERRNRRGTVTPSLSFQSSFIFISYQPTLMLIDALALSSHRHTRPCRRPSALGPHALSHGANTS